MAKIKDSGVFWLGKIPEEWEISKISSVYELRTQKVSDRDYPPLSVTMKGIVPQLETAAKTNAHDDRKLVKKGDFAINSRSDRRGSCGISDYDGSVSLINIVMKPRESMNSSYYNWLFHTIQFSDEFYKWGHGIVDDLWTTNWQDMKHIDIPVPYIGIQCQIASYLDEKCSEIDSLYLEIEEQIKVLEEYKKSVITEAVTKGLNPDVKMKDSGIEWIGEIPQHWKTQKAKYIFVLRNSRGNDMKLQLLSPTQRYGVIPQEIYEEISGMTAVKLKEDTNLELLKTIHYGDFCISLRSFQGGFEYSEYEGVCSPAYQVFFSKESVENRYYKYIFKEKCFINKINSFSLSLRDGKNISFSDFGNMYIPVPSLDEQRQIADYLDTKCAEIDSTIADKQHQLSILEQYKKSLIYEYVTGKKEVPA